jgi:hypothetical protein
MKSGTTTAQHTAHHSLGRGEQQSAQWRPAACLPAVYLQQCTAPPFQIIRYSKNLEESNNFKFDQNYRENYKNL